MPKTHNELVLAICQRVEYLANLSLPELRRWHPECYNTGTDYEAQQATVGLSKGAILHHILLEEFGEEFDREYAE